jgi:hypothetical protein
MSSKTEKTCHKCGKNLKKEKTSIQVRTEHSRPDDCYDGSYKYIYFYYCPCWQKQKEEKHTIGIDPVNP